MKTIILLSIIFLCSCNMEVLFFDAPPDFNYTPPQEDTTSAPVVVVDTCETLVHIDTPAFTLLSTFFFNGLPAFFEWHWGNETQSYLSLVSLMEAKFPQYEYTYYERNGAVALFVDGVFDNSLFQGKIWTRDAIEQKALLTALGQTFYFWGALEFNEAIIEAEKRPSVKSFHFTNFGWTVEENNKFARVVLHPELCKHGEYIARLVDAGIVPTLVDSFYLFEWQFVLQLNDQLIKA